MIRLSILGVAQMFQTFSTSNSDFRLRLDIICLRTSGVLLQLWLQRILSLLLSLARGDLRKIQRPIRPPGRTIFVNFGFRLATKKQIGLPTVSPHYSALDIKRKMELFVV